jgi:LmbE family N-acetylglucosaminyl deacetylase
MTLRSAVCFFAHPDDETMLAGGLIALMVQQNIQVHVVCATRGEGGDRGNPPVVEHQHELGAVREQELRCAVGVLGASLTILDYMDPLIGPDSALFPFEADFDQLTRQFVDIARRRQADLILTHGVDGEYGHPAHQLIHRAVLTGARQMLPRTLVYTVAALVPNIEDRLWNKSEPAHLALDIRAWGERKAAAIDCFVSQHALFKRFTKIETVREAMRPVEAVRRQQPDTHGEPPDDDFAHLLRTAGAWTP